MKVFFTILFFIAFCLTSFGETPQQVINPKQAYNKWVSDMADVISDEDELLINDLIDQLEKKTSAEIAVVTIKNAGNMTPKDFATELFNLWGIGKKGKDNGVLVLLVMDTRRIEVETGYGVEGVLTDGKVGEILDNYVIPIFKEGDFGKGILNGIQVMVKMIEGDMTETFQPMPSDDIVKEKREKN
ncbi:MAG: TPM domain-containing protein, partial [Candidatus Poribacteria bacterium]